MTIAFEPLAAESFIETHRGRLLARAVDELAPSGSEATGPVAFAACCVRRLPDRQACCGVVGAIGVGLGTRGAEPNSTALSVRFWM
jgi:hypothetical protein